MKLDTRSSYSYSGGGFEFHCWWALESFQQLLFTWSLVPSAVPALFKVVHIYLVLLINYHNCSQQHRLLQLVFFQLTLFWTINFDKIHIILNPTASLPVCDCSTTNVPFCSAHSSRRAASGWMTSGSLGWCGINCPKWHRGFWWTCQEMFSCILQVSGKETELPKPSRSTRGTTQ